MRPRSVGLRRKIVGIGLIAISVLAFATPLAAGTWSLQFLSIFPLAIGLTELYTGFQAPRLQPRPSSYFTGFLAIDRVHEPVACRATESGSSDSSSM